MVLTAYFVLSRVTGLFCHPRPRKLPSADLTPASGRQDHTTSPSARNVIRLLTCRIHRIPPHVRDDRETPLCMGRDGEGYAGDLRQKGMEIFLKEGLDMQITFFIFCHGLVPAIHVLLER
jgi:hypothetical protein